MVLKDIYMEHNDNVNLLLSSTDDVVKDEKERDVGVCELNSLPADTAGEVQVHTGEREKNVKNESGLLKLMCMYHF